MTEDLTTLRAVVSGRVQGVGFRYFVLQHGRRLAVEGTARNLANGSVEVLARGRKETLLELIELLRQGPRLSHVEDVRIEWGTPVPETAGFEIRT